MKNPKPTKRRIAHAEAFNAGALAIAAELGATPDAHPVFDNQLIVDTKYGPMTINPSTDPESVLDGLHKGCFFTVFCRFKDHARYPAAAKVLDSNPYSGKYNFHCSAGNSAEDLQLVLQRFRAHIQKVLP